MAFPSPIMVVSSGSLGLGVGQVPEIMHGSSPEIQFGLPEHRCKEQQPVSEQSVCSSQSLSSPSSQRLPNGVTISSVYPSHEDGSIQPVLIIRHDSHRS